MVTLAGEPVGCSTKDEEWRAWFVAEMEDGLGNTYAGRSIGDGWPGRRMEVSVRGRWSRLRIIRSDLLSKPGIRTPECENE